MKLLTGFCVSISLFGFLCLLTTCTKEAPANTAASNNGAGGSLARYSIVGNYLYLVNRNHLDVYDCTDLAKPTFRSSSLVGFDIETIYPYNNKLFIGAASGMYVYSLADPANPKREGSVTHIRSCDPVVANDSVAYVTLRSFGTTCGSSQSVLNVYDVKQLQQPKLIKTVVMTSPYGLGIQKNALYVCDGNNGLSVFDISKGYEPAIVGTIKGEVFFDVIPYNDILICYIEKGITFFDIKNPLKPISAGTIKD